MMVKSDSQLQAEIDEALRPPEWAIVARLSSDRYDDPQEILDRLALDLERRFAGSTTMREASYPHVALLIKTHELDAAKKFAADWIYDLATPSEAKRKAAEAARKRPARVKKASTTKASTIQISEHDAFKLEPASSKTHYGDPNGSWGARSSGGIPYAFRTKKADDAWLVVSRINGKVLGVVEEGSGGDWSYQKVKGYVAAPRWVKDAMTGSIGSVIYELESRVHSGPTMASAIAHGMGIKIP